MDFLNAIILLLNYIFIPALTYGSQLALGAIFVTLIYGILRFANFATGDMMSFGTMVTILFTWYFQSIGISLGVLPTALIAIPFAILMVEQNAKQALNISDRGYVLVTGENRYSGTGNELLNDPRVRSSFLGG